MGRVRSPDVVCWKLPQIQYVAVLSCDCAHCKYFVHSFAGLKPISIPSDGDLIFYVVIGDA